ncbi:glutathione S-transferase family protein [Mesorhizobium sp. A623]
MKLYRAELSGHSHRVQLFLGLLGLPYTLIDVDLAHGAHKRPDFLAKNPLGQVPVIEDGDACLYDSNAILTYLAKKYDDGHWLPADPVSAARIQQWLSLAAGQIANGPAAARMVTVFGASIDHEKAKALANHVLKVLDAELAHRNFTVGDTPTIADGAGYSYIAKAPEGGVSLEPYPSVRAWLKRIEDLPGFVPFKETKAGLLASQAS